MQLALRRPDPVALTPTSGMPRSAVSRWAAMLLVLLCAAYHHDLPAADARDHHLRSGPPAEAYPWAEQRGVSLDLWGFVARQCTSYAAWYLNTHGVPFALLTRGPGGRALFTSAGGWDDAAAAAGFPVRSTPAVGSIAQWDPGEASPPAVRGAGGDTGDHVIETAGRYGHVAVVQDVLPNGWVVVSEYDGGDRSFHRRTTRAPRYLYIGIPGDPPRRSAAPALW